MQTENAGMKKNTKILSRAILSVLTFLFLQIFNAYHFYYIEQFQLFQNTFLYFKAYLSHPGGLVEYISHFIVQFYIVPYLGAFITTVFLVLIYVGTTKLILRKTNQKNLFVAPATVFLACLFISFDFNIFFQAILSFALCIGCLNVFVLMKDSLLKTVGTFIVVPILYWFAGPIAILFALAFCFHKLFGTNGNFVSRLLWLLLPVYTVFMAWVSYRFYFVGNLRLALLPDMYYQSQLKPGFLLYIPGLLLLFWIPVVALLSELRGFVMGHCFNCKNSAVFGVFLHRKYWLVGLQGIVVLFLFVQGFILFRDKDSYVVKKLDYFARNENWNRIVAVSQTTSIHNYLHLNYLNLALAQKKQLLKRMFEFTQKGSLSLQVPSEKKNLVYGVLSDINFCIGNIASSQQYAFEGCEMCSGGGNVRLMKRLVQTNLILGEYAVAEKYIKILEHTFFYATWASDQRKFLYNEKLCQKDSVLGEKMKCLPEKGSRYYTIGGPETLPLLVNINPTNESAREYFVAYLLLTKDVNLFLQSLSHYEQEGAISSPMPELFQQAVLAFYDKDPQTCKQFGISKNTIKLFKDYRQMALKTQNSSHKKEIMHKYFGSTYWYYLEFVSI